MRSDHPARARKPIVFEMLTRSDFGTNHSAYIAYLQTRPAPDAIAELTRLAREDGLVDLGAEWLRAAMWFAQRCAWDAEVVGTLALDAVEPHPVEAFRELVVGLSGFIRRDCSPSLLCRLLAWLERAEPGDGLVVGRAMLGFLAGARSAEALEPFAPLATKMLDSHGGILRDRIFAPLAFWILDVVRHHSPSHIGTTLRYLAASEGVWTVSYVDWDESGDIFWSAVELHLENGGDEALIGDVLGAPAIVGSVSRRWLFTPIQKANFPRSRHALVRALCEGRVSHNQSDFAHVVAVAPPDALLNPECWSPLVFALKDASVAGQVRDETLDAWAEYCTREWFRAHGLQRSTELTQLGWHLRLQAGVRRALEDRLDRAPLEAHALARRILEERDDAVVWPALAALEGPEAQPVFDEAMLERVRLELERFVNLPWRHPVCGLDLRGLLTGCRSVSFDVLPGGDKARIEPPNLVFDRDSIIGLLKALPPSDGLLGGLVYALHELVHLPQGLQKMRTVTQLRVAGAETTLLHLDLAADHVTALLLKELYPARTLADLKRFEGELLALFPIGRFHTPGATERKMRRLVSLRADFILRRERLISDEMGYIFVELGVGRGPIAFLASGPPYQVLFVGETMATDRLRDAARTMAIADVDSFIESALPKEAW